MIRFLTIILAITSSLFCFAQESSDKGKNTAVGLSFSSNYSHMIITYSDEISFIGKTLEKNAKPAFGYNCGLFGGYHIREHIELELAFQFSKQAFSFKNVPISSGDTYESFGSADSEYRFHYFEIPLRGKYIFLDKKFFSYVSGGISCNLFLYDEVKNRLDYNDGTSEVITDKTHFEDINKVVWAAQAGMGLGYRIQGNYKVSIEPLFRYSIRPITNGSIEHRNYSIGAQISYAKVF